MDIVKKDWNQLKKETGKPDLKVIVFILRVTVEKEVLRPGNQ